MIGRFLAVVGVLGRLAVLLGIEPGPEDNRFILEGVLGRAPFTFRSG